MSTKTIDTKDLETSIFDTKPKLKKLILPLCFLVPFILMFIAYAVYEVHPFGDKQVMVVDFWHQYYPFLQLLAQKLKDGASLLYSWESGMGSNFIALASYYCSSPMNLLTFFIPIEYLREFTALLIVTKIGCAGLSMGFFLRKYCKTEDLSIVFFSTMFACCAFFMGYCWNIMWLDSAAFMPLVMLGIYQLITEGKWRLYAFSLAFCLFSNYYIGLFICIFSVISFFLFHISLGVKFKALIRNGLRFAAFSLMAGALASVVLLPAYEALQLTCSADSSFTKDLEWYHSWSEIFTQMLSFIPPSKVEGLPNLACGLLSVLLIFAYITMSSIPLRERISYLVASAFMLMSCNLNLLQWLWNGGHFPNMIPYRFSFLFSFLLVTMACRAYQKIRMHQGNKYQIIGMIAIFVSYLAIAYDTLEDKIILLKNGIFGVAMLFILSLYICKKLNRQFLNGTIAVIVCVEMTFTTLLGRETVGTSSYSAYPKNTEAVNALVDQIESMEDENSFYRTEIAKKYTLNDSCLYDFNGISQFSSMANCNISDWMTRIGLSASKASNRYTYMSSSPFTNMLLNLKYVISTNGYMPDGKMYTEIGEEYTYKMKDGKYLRDDTTGEKVKSDTNKSYSFNYYLPIAYMTEQALPDIEDYEKYHPFHVQNELVHVMTGIQEDLFEPIDIINVGHKNVHVTRRDYGAYKYDVASATEEESDGGKPTLKFNYQLPEDGLYYCYIEGSKIESVTINKGDSKIRSCELGTKPWMFGCGFYKEGETFSVCSELKDDATVATFHVYVYKLNEEVLQKVYDALADETLEVSAYSDTKIEGTVTANQDGVLYTSIPYEKGWSAYVDGQKTETFANSGAFVALNLSQGTHTIVFKYVPSGFYPALFLLAIALTCILILLLTKHKVLAVSENDMYFEEPIPLFRKKDAKGEKESNQTKQSGDDEIVIAEIEIEDETLIPEKKKDKNKK